MAEPLNYSPGPGDPAEGQTAPVAAPTAAKPVSQQAFYPDGRAIPDSELATAIANDQARWKKGTRVMMRALDGSGRHFVDAEEARSAVARGWGRPETPEEKRIGDIDRKLEEYDGLAGDWAAHAWGVGSSASFGLLDVAAGEALTPQQKEVLQRFLNRHETAKTIGEIQGVLTPLGPEALAAEATGALGRVGLRALAGPGGLALRAGKGAAGIAEKGLVKAGLQADGILGRTITGGVAGAVETAPFTAGRELARQSLGNEDYNVEKILSAAGEGLLYGGAIGGAGGAVSGIFGKRAASQAAKATEDLSPAERAWVRSNRLTAREQELIGREEIQLAFKEAMENGHVPKDMLKAAAESMPEKASKWRQWKGELGEAVGQHYKDADALGKLDSSKMIKESADLIGKLRDAKGHYADYANLIEKKYFATFAEIENKVNAQGHLVSAYGSPRMQSFKDLHKTVSDLGSEIDRLVANKETPKAEALTEFYAVIKRNLVEDIARLDPNLATSLQATDRLYSAVSKFEKYVSPKALGYDTSVANALEPHDYGFLVGGMALGEPIVGTGIFLGRALSRELKSGYRFNAGLARYLNDYRKTSVSQAQAVSGAVQQAATANTLKISPKVPMMASGLDAAFNDRADATAKAVNNPELLLKQLAPTMAVMTHVDPVAARKIPATVKQDLEWLYKRLPASPSPSSFINIAARESKEAQEKLRVPASAASEFVRTARTLADPVAAIEDIPSRGVSPELADVLNERRPKLKEAVTERYEQFEWELAQKGQKMSYKSRVEASILTGRPFDATMTPEYIFEVQAMWDQTRAADAAQAAGPSAQASKEMRHRRLSTSRTSYQEGMERGD